MNMQKGCPLCGRENVNRTYQGSERYYDCPHCGRYGINDILAHQEEYNKSYHGQSHLLRGYIFQRSRDNYGAPPVFLSRDDVEAALAKCPKDVEGKSKALLANIVKAQRHFGELVGFDLETLTRLGFGKNKDEARALLNYLAKEDLVQDHSSLNDACVVVTGRGMREFESSRLGLPMTPTVFISSTCYDLLDLRSELAAHLEQSGFAVRLSDDPARIAVDPTIDSIQTCLTNLESSDVVACIIDRRYGPVLGGRYGDISATHAEVRHALAMTPPKPIFYFVREVAWLEYGLLRRDPTLKVQWVEQDNPKQRAKWVAFVKEIAELPGHVNRSNWVTRFKSSSDLKSLVVNCLNNWTMSQ